MHVEDLKQRQHFVDGLAIVGLVEVRAVEGDRGAVPKKKAGRRP
jgi:hypothetical protein